MTDIEYVMACIECGVNRAWPNYLCNDCKDFICDTCNSWDDDLQAGVCECCRLEIY
jgi:hypothetical protein